MENFVYYNPVKLHFGKNVIRKLGQTARSLGSKALLLYGKGSIKSNGIYDQVTDQFRQANITWVEYAGIRPNPAIEDVVAAARLGREENVDFIVAVGGGSVIDSAKFTSIAIPYDGPAWNLVKGTAKPGSNTPLIAVLTLAATGTEMNKFAVVQNNATSEKLGFGNDLIYPRYSFLDPQYTLSVPKNYTSYGIVDLIAHCLEAYFGKGEATLSDKFVYSIIREAMEFGPALLNDLENYELRAKIMYAATNALNNLLLYGRESGDWGVHSIGHVFSVLYDVPHGASLSIAYPAWLRLMKDRIPERIEELGKHLFNTSSANDTIAEMESLFGVLGSPVRLNDIGINVHQKNKIIQTMIKNEVGGVHHKLSQQDYEELIDLCLQ
ncbi:MAG: iron-containing alcohol dehydrogenase [Bacteroidota bacterium]|nr:iron-containing alcohol dehydrogenase [Bacteroidota bacterium]